MKDKNINIRINKDLKEDIMRESNNRGITISKFITKCIENEFSNINNTNIYSNNINIMLINVINDLSECINNIEQEDIYNKIYDRMLELEKAVIVMCEENKNSEDNIKN